ncbi:hypothetical protein Bccel_2443 [Pseudobacteroides cellulosolvens ATCC 35603 = DSM 2933]|uniref:Uncharacterized protein n=1 Tax=Pseudobacteroides cellulosolvens ATCC 35603 = DSM 2933 TaxID=398512 RepID=A0A0L6JN52_9FIRM|nr:hypothetical protein Bccel_2443 [Pseudobacteroides cellulosolvens ATCC 35603 = DSM 2933]
MMLTSMRCWQKSGLAEIYRINVLIISKDDNDWSPKVLNEAKRIKKIKELL